MPKIYAFDTGFVSFARGWDPLRPEDYGLLWEHLVLDHLRAHFPEQPVRYWRDKAGREVDFILAPRRGEIDAIECEWDPGAFDSSSLKVFRSHYPKGRNYLVTPSAETAYTRSYGDVRVTLCTPTQLCP
jgi:predicted AAA+ superfamily ATPase